MPSLEENRAVWDGAYDWSRGGGEWSDAWGGVDMQWHAMLWPRLHRFLPTGTVLEIAPGFGRWSRYVKDLCTELVLVDLSEACMRACYEQFREDPKVKFHLNDGKSLEFQPDESVDFVFSFDSLVHAEADVLEAYVSQIGRKLKPGGMGFIHHSNLGEFERYYRFWKWLPFGKEALTRAGLLDNVATQWRAPSMTAEKFVDYATAAGLTVLGQELFNWVSRREIDCISIFTRSPAPAGHRPTIVRNPHFMRHAAETARLSPLYSR